MFTEKQLKEVLVGIYETDYKIDGVRKVGYADNGEVYAY